MVSLKFLNALKRPVARQVFRGPLLIRTLCFHDVNVSSETNLELINVLNKIVYNNRLFVATKIELRKAKVEHTQSPPKAHCIKLILNDQNPPKNKDTNNASLRNSGVPRGPPVSIANCKLAKNFVKEAALNENIKESVPDDVASLIPEDTEKAEPPINWELMYHGKLTTEIDIPDVMRFGSCDPKIPISSVPCGGCGALLQCMDEGMPGFLPQELFKSVVSVKKLRFELCQRCFFLQEFNIGLGINVSPDEYPKLLSQIKNKHVLIVLMIDILDFPCSICPDITNIIGSNCVIVVVNKVDLLIRESPDYEKQFKKSVLRSLSERGINEEKILQILFISAKYGNSVEALINCISKMWKFQGDIYLVGSTNVGKSTLFNTLLQSDICSENTENSVRKATISAWPGTTLNLLKFPMRSIRRDLLYHRNQRLREKKMEIDSNRNTGRSGLKRNLLPDNEIHRIERTKVIKPGRDDGTNFQNWESVKADPGSIDPNDKRYMESKWCHDTPGVILRGQITNLLTISELLTVSPQNIILPRNFLFESGYSLFVGGIARVDLIEASSDVWLTVYASMKLPITATKTDDADEVYRALLGSNLFQVPCGGPKRLSKWPELASKTFHVSGRLHNEACGDIVLSSAGWISVYIQPAYYAKITAWTPEGRGIHLRKVPLIRTGHLFRGKPIGTTPAFEISTRKQRVDFNKW